ncbi:hypothetical protein [Stigmatella erecta]|uniref:Uncharacterized protein n=1 Tax=Stigmatella erecta TaxID=83460 RepID=A0A1I0ENT9_9BACT|nr:hypothetical protein [Stigmatella erecta]SET46875.1 hypothetical protein SAMN05443639_10360 [Stigmatella erecta]
MTLKFTGNETPAQVLERLLSHSQELYGKEIRLTTLTNAFQGELVDKGSQFVVLKTATGRYTMGEPRQEIVQTHLVVLNQITGFSFETLSTPT